MGLCLINHLVKFTQALMTPTAPVVPHMSQPLFYLWLLCPLPGRCRRFTPSWWGSSASASCCLTTPSTKTQSGEIRTHVFTQVNVFPPAVDLHEWVKSSPKPTSTVFLSFFFYRGDPTLVKINVAITTGYLISGKRNAQWPTAVIVAPKLDKCGNYTIRWIQIFSCIQT